MSELDDQKATALRRQREPLDPDDPLGDLERRLAEKPEHLRRRPDGSLIMVKCDDPTCCSPREPRG